MSLKSRCSDRIYGILGEYMARTYMEVKPHLIIKQMNLSNNAIQGIEEEVMAEYALEFPKKVL